MEGVKKFCGLVERLLPGITLLVGYDDSELIPLPVAVVT